MVESSKLFKFVCKIFGSRQSSPRSCTTSVETANPCWALTTVRGFWPQNLSRKKSAWFRRRVGFTIPPRGCLRGLGSCPTSCPSCGQKRRGSCLRTEIRTRRHISFGTKRRWSWPTNWFQCWKKFQQNWDEFLAFGYFFASTHVVLSFTSWYF